MSGSVPVKLSYDLYVPSQGHDDMLPPVILLHGMTSSRASWLNIPQIIADDTKRKVYALDARNHGESEWSDEFDYDVMARDIDNFMDEINVPKTVLVGHSMGGKTAMVLALSKPEKVEKLIVEDMSPKRLPATEKRFPFFYIKLMRDSLSHVPHGSDLKTAREIIFEYINSGTPEEHRIKKGNQRLGTTLPLKMTDEGVAWQPNLDVIENAFFNNPRLRSEFEGIYDKETLFLYGTKSVYAVDKTKDMILKLFPKAVLEGIEGATHLVHMEFPEEFCTKVVNFIGKK